MLERRRFRNGSAVLHEPLDMKGERMLGKPLHLGDCATGSDGAREVGKESPKSLSFSLWIIPTYRRMPSTHLVSRTSEPICRLRMSRPFLADRTEFHSD